MVGIPSFSDTGILLQLTGNTNSYNQAVIQNTNSGANASANYIVNNNLGTLSTYFGEFGINSSGFTGTGSFNSPNSVYVDSANGDLALGTTTANAIHFVANNSATDAMTISSAGVTSLGTPLAITSGGTGTANQQNAINALTGTQTSGYYLRSNGTNSSLTAIQISDVPTLNQNTTGTSSNVTGTVAIANGGTNATTASAALSNLGGIGLTNLPTSFRNKIINGDNRIDQRNAGASQTITAGAALAYTDDRWFMYCTGANVTGQDVTSGINNFQDTYQITGAASNTGIVRGQRIESYNAYDLAGNTATLQAQISSNTLTTVTWTAYYANTSDTFGTVASPTKTQISTGTFTINSTPTKYTVNITMPASAINGVEIDFSTGAFTSGTLSITGVQLEKGSVATPFEFLPLTVQQILCERYSVNISSYYLGLIATTSSLYGGQITLPVPIRSTPTMTNASFTVGGGNAGTPALLVAGGYQVVVNNSANNWTAGNYVTITALISNEL
jgi:hypothetical protein